MHEDDFINYLIRTYIIQMFFFFFVNGFWVRMPHDNLILVEVGFILLVIYVTYI